MGHWSDTLKNHVRDLLIRMEEEACHGCPCDHFLHVQIGSCKLTWSERETLREKHDWNDEEARHKRDDGEEVDVIQRSFLLSHELLAEDVSGLEGDVRSHSRNESGPVEGRFGGRSEGYTSHHRQQGQHNGERGCISQEDGGQQHGKEGFHGLDGVREGDGHFSQGHVGQQIAQRVHNCQRQDGQQHVLVHLGFGMELECPHG
eukprot:scaffold840_cov344-Pavlova_lutheri.AAC.59